ncbi:hypothetical protein Lser_V15G31403 [Lactuca serriola]
MKRVFRISEITAAKSELLCCHRRFSVPKSLTNQTTIPTSTRWFSTEESHSLSSKTMSDLYGQFADKWAYAEVRAKEELIEKVSVFRDELVKNVKDENSFEKLLEVKGWKLFTMYSNGAALLELLRLLESNPHLAMKVFNWRREREDRPMSSEEYAKGIKIAGRMKNVDLALEIFAEATTKRIKTTSTYNALMGVYMWNGLSEKCQSVYHDLKQDTNCRPTSATFNMLISIFGYRVLIDQMEAVFQEMKDSNIAPTLTTYNNLIAGYLTAWMWESMENTYRMMETGSIRPDLETRLLMLRGYAHSGNLEKMEEMYNIIGGPHIREKHIPLIRAMICAYCKSICSNRNRVKRIEELMKMIPENEYRPWLNVLIIRVYAQEDLVDQMDRSIDEAFDRNTSVNAVKIMQTIAATYIRNNAVDKLARFVKRAGDSGWRICRSLFHGLLWMFASHKRIEEMEEVLVEMERFNYGCSKRTFVILYKAYSEQEEDEGYKRKLHRVLGLMCKHGYGVPS